MTCEKGKAVTSVNVIGVAKADFDTVGFGLTIEGLGKNGAAAKDAARPAIDAVRNLLEALKADGVAIDDKSVESALTVSQRMEYNRTTGEQKKAGYTAAFTLSFQSSSVDRASEVHDRLTMIGNVEAASPDFRIKDLAGLHKLALADAHAKATERLNNECAVFGLEPGSLRVLSWGAQYDDRQSAGPQAMKVGVMAAASAAPESPIEINAGEAVVQVRLTVNYGVKQASSKPAARPARRSPTARSASASR